MPWRERATTRAVARLAVALLAAGGLLAVFVAAPPPAAAQGDCTVAADDLNVDGAETQALAEVNAFRQANGIAALQPSDVLNRAAAWITRDQVRNNYDAGAGFNHPDLQGRQASQRQLACGYPGMDGQENLYWGEGTRAGVDLTGPQAAVQWWKDSPFGHREAMLNGGHRFAGVAHACTAAGRCYWALELSPQGGGAPPPGGGAPAPKPATPDLPWVEQGANGEAVKTIQYLLRHRGADIVVDGDFGSQTDDRVRAFQEANGLIVDGAVGPQTWPKFS
jgi:uncharacterized protein YkwD